MIDRYIRRLYFSSEEVAKALTDAGFNLRPEDCSSVKFGTVAESLGKLARNRVRTEMERALDCLVEEAKG